MAIRHQDISFDTVDEFLEYRQKIEVKEESPIKKKKVKKHRNGSKKNKIKASDRMKWVQKRTKHLVNKGKKYGPALKQAFKEYRKR